MKRAQPNALTPQSRQRRANGRRCGRERARIRIVIVQHLEHGAARAVRNDLLTHASARHGARQATEVVTAQPTAVVPAHHVEQERDGQRRQGK